MKYLSAATWTPKRDDLKDDLMDDIRAVLAMDYIFFFARGHLDYFEAILFLSHSSKD